MGQLEAARLLVGKARQDEYVLERLAGDPQVADEAFGFHAQQAAEKLLKAALAAAAVVYPRTHRLGELIDLGRDRGLAVPDEFDELHRLTPFAVEYRYEFFSEEVEKPLGGERGGRAWLRAIISRPSGTICWSVWRHS
ncbi:MAG: HEPN domain-containing protein [Verrucomicrobia bacterium]|nr:HEPN domain-containing protein [Verrucomicrobiota bacterium]